MPKMFRLNHDGTVDLCDDTPDFPYKGPKYMRSSMRHGVWVYIYIDDRGEHHREYIDDRAVPDIIKMFNLLEV